ncbi:MAG: M15 family metallopeptidase [Cyanobacteria bacterium M_DeepCast_100m_m1_067]|nr:M15 family metallopeptidase [Cyanobacteria bacterium M_DeepCast_100m_m1_067]
MALRPWSPIPIVEAGEPLVALPPQLWRLQPHPYVSLGAPYGVQGDPFRLRRGVVERLLQAEQELRHAQFQCRLAIFDAWRPLAVQRFMVRHAVEEECARAGVDPDQPSTARDRVITEVGRFWAPPSDDPATPPPHSTGAAVDLTLADGSGVPLAMGGEIDAIGPVSEPAFYADAALADPGGDAALWHGRRQLLAQVMAGAGFAQHPNEWWHFSWGDQLWAWRRGQGQARYGRIGEAASSLAS